MEARITRYGEAAWLVAFEPRLSAEVNARVLAVAAAVTAQRLPGVRDIVPAAASLAVHVDPASADPVVMARALQACARAPVVSPGGRQVEIPVCYGKEFGPDLQAVATLAGIPASEVVALHAAADYRVFMLGFLPGFPYLGAVDERIAAPRLATPRARVPAGSVGIAGRQTGIYPVESPGGWRIVGRTPVVLFNERRTPPAALQPGDRVRFVPIDRDAFLRLGPGGESGWR